ncbi:hypothetical protein AAFN60_21430 [Roseibacillus persicicus]|uniref:hypothetical protein n=1 Tax=Roseibacillus persicicus TaxID=454148 RepID=UPI00398B525F
MLSRAAIYLADPSMLGSRFLELFDDDITYEGLKDGNHATGMLLKLPWGQLKLNFMPDGEMEEHLRGFSGYIQRFATDSETNLYAQARLHYVNMVAGCEIEHHEEDEDFVSFLFKLSGGLNGLLFFYDRVYDFSGDVLASSRADE